MGDSSALPMPGRPTRTCDCPTCRASGALDVLSGSLDEMLNRACENEMSLAYLRDELRALLSSPWSLPFRRRIKRILRTGGGHG